VGRQKFLSNLFSNKKTKVPLFQVLLIDNGSSEDVEIQESKQVNFFQVKEHLKNGGSVFITSKDTQKIAHPKASAQVNYSKSRRNYGVIFRQNLRSS
jgi:hypothetical protein